ncbi:TetR/AcrR family transcriptional regulator [Nakamurella leprariae]|uniref:TetR family transcriptional regulator n=1 Tax=Nakamurella leprariae TaxID=2803911 RepID=A0A938YGF8_9ACTN|nr:TetR/AcrR family transcriptional regulator [Nakamurella leprariae]MBM9469056.1 TetR family transcriptional regulator [Nakamurella leprariae]
MSLDDRRAEIITSAAELFDRMGYSNTTMDDIGRTVGIAKPTLYHYFSGKDQILASIHEEFIDLLLEKNERRQQAGLAPEQRLLEVMVDIMELMETHRGHVRVFFEHHRELPEADQPAMRDKRDRYEAAVAHAIKQGTADGTFRDTDPRLAALALFGMCNWAYQWYQASGPLRPREIAYQFWDIFVRGIAAHPRGQTAG